MDRFEGKLYHSGDWDWEREEEDPTFKWADQKVGVIGNGSSAVQIVPTLQKRAQHVKNFGRSKSGSELSCKVSCLSQCGCHLDGARKS
jgi:cation diffusion facilitator CzcD-associated flavoprotein CzcO